MPAAIRTSGQMWNADDQQQDTKFVIPDSSYAALYDETVRALPRARRLRPDDDGHASRTSASWRRRPRSTAATTRPSRSPPPAPSGSSTTSGDRAARAGRSSAGDIFRACQTKDAPIKDWVQLAVRRARATGAPAVFWLDETRAHDAEVLKKVRAYLAEEDTDGLTIEVKDVAEATRYTLERARRGEDTISVTGNVLRDYLTDLFPILELGTSAKMLSIVPLMNGGGLFETGAGGSAPKHVQQLVKENYLRWDSLGEFLALAVSFEFLGEKTDNARAALLGTTLDEATGRVLEENRSPARKVGQIDNRGSHFYLALYWAQALAQQTEDPDAAALFADLAERLAADEETIIAELLAVQGSPGRPRRLLLRRQGQDRRGHAPSATFNAALAEF